ncbi:Copper resistance protein CopC [Collimonas arenae]|uniref:Copper resistance protein CopC n=1 Tax=Collimonas arenae TaxID=279058 RepID=A0A0A1F3X2_9BURK|nr:copper homeostasis periplasmic binding protein CopC [Collimonas arenae]AIY39418.1 Copper resistance protein CopC [Collimonas arenae]
MSVLSTGFKTAVIAALLSFSMMENALAHAHLKVEVPAHDTVVATAPATLRLEFSEALELAFSGVALSDAKGNSIATGAVSLAPESNKTLLVPLSGHLAAGVYTVSWHALSRDGHKTKGRYSFTVQPG